jgi:hypothetical protein
MSYSHVVVRALLAITLFAAPALAQREARAGAVRVAAEDTACWSNSQAPCDDIARAEVAIDARVAARVRVVSVEVTPEGRPPQIAADLHAMRRMDMVRTRPPRRTNGFVRFAARERDVLVIHFTPVRASDGRVRVTLEINGRRVVVEAAHVVYTEHPDPDL